MKNTQTYLTDKVICFRRPIPIRGQTAQRLMPTTKKDLNKVSIHYFQSQSGKVFDVKVKPGWSN